MSLTRYITKVLNKAFAPVEGHDESQIVNDVWDNTHTAMEELAKKAFNAGRKTRYSIFANRDIHVYQDFNEYKHK